jgi:hypothetical protein
MSFEVPRSASTFLGKPVNTSSPRDWQYSANKIAKLLVSGALWLWPFIR